MVAAMHSYRCYFLDAEHHIVNVEMFDCPDDDSAILCANAIVNRHPVSHSLEVWYRADLIAGWQLMT
jgi:hypothetical protein